MGTDYYCEANEEEDLSLDVREGKVGKENRERTLPIASLKEKVSRSIWGRRGKETNMALSKKRSTPPIRKKPPRKKSAPNLTPELMAPQNTYRLSRMLPQFLNIITVSSDVPKISCPLIQAPRRKEVWEVSVTRGPYFFHKT